MSDDGPMTSKTIVKLGIHRGGTMKNVATGWTFWSSLCAENYEHCGVYSCTDSTVRNSKIIMTVSREEKKNGNWPVAFICFKYRFHHYIISRTTRNYTEPEHDEILMQN